MEEHEVDVVGIEGGLGECDGFSALLIGQGVGLVGYHDVSPVHEAEAHANVGVGTVVVRCVPEVDSQGQCVPQDASALLGGEVPLALRSVRPFLDSERLSAEAEP